MSCHNPGLPFKRTRRAVGLGGAFLAAAFFAWLLLGFLETVPSMLDVFGMVGMRIPASITIAALLLAAIGFYEP